ncbi:MAG: ATP-binding protein, partial [Rubrobacteraceae bacterium]
YSRDWRAVPPAAWLEMLAERELSPETPKAAPANDRCVVLGEEEFASALRQALRDLHSPDRLKKNPLLRSRIVSDQAGTSENGSVEALRAVIMSATDSLRTSSCEAKLHRALHHTFIQPAPTQEQAARLLDLPFSTYRRHLKGGVKRVADILWEKEIG